jgi:transposase InsO family protein
MEKVGADLFSYKERQYLVTSDYFSGFFELDFIPQTNSNTVITKMKHHFARHGIPDKVISDGGPQFTSAEFKSFETQWGFSHEFSSPGNSKANGVAEAGSVSRTLKRPQYAK